MHVTLTSQRARLILTLSSLESKLENNYLMNIIQWNPLIKAVFKSTLDWISPSTSLSKNEKLTDKLTVFRLQLLFIISTTIHPGEHTVLSGLRPRPLLNPSGPALQAAVVMSIDNEEKSHRHLFIFFRSYKINPKSYPKL